MRGDLCAHCSRAEDRYAANHHLWHSTGWWLVVSGWYAGRVNTAFEILAALSFCHLLNDMMQSLIAAFIVLRYGQASIAWFSLAALLAMAFLVRVGSWYKGSGAMHAARRPSSARHDAVSSHQVVMALAILVALLFSKFIYLASL